MKKKTYSTQKTLEEIRRKNEILEYGKVVSLRPSKVHESKKKYKRKPKHRGDVKEEV